MRSARAASWASGFSTKQCLPASSALIARSPWVGTGVVIAAACRLGVRGQVRQIGGEVGVRVDRRVARARGLVGVAAPGQIAALERVQVASDVGSPSSRGRRRRRGWLTFREGWPSQPHHVVGAVAACDAAEVEHERRLGNSLSWSTSGCAVTMQTRSAPRIPSSNSTESKLELGQRGRGGRDRRPRRRGRRAS